MPVHILGFGDQFAKITAHVCCDPAGILSKHNSNHSAAKFVVSEAEAAAIRAVFLQHGELSAAIELRRRFPGITDNAQARECARTIAGWKPLPVTPRPVTALAPRPGRGR